MSVSTFSLDDIELSMTEAAKSHFRNKISKREEKSVRLWIKKSGCSGFMYELDFVDHASEGDKTFVFEDITLHVSSDALPIIQGTEIDMLKDGLNHMIQFNNPNAKATCGCGESFTL